MADNENGKLLMNRIAAFAAGALVTFAVVNFTVVSSAKAETAAMAAALDATKYQAGRLMADAKGQLEKREYAQAKESLAALFAKQPGAPEAPQAKILLASVEAAEKSANLKWDAAAPALRAKWAAERNAALRAESDKARAQMEKDLVEKGDSEWESAKAKVRQDWEKTVQM